MLTRSKSIKEIYDETKNYDLVITNDAPLATGLNKLIDYPRLDNFAMTPRQIAAKFALLHFDKLYSSGDLIVEISRRTKKPLKLIHQSIQKIFEVWNNTGLLESCKLFLGEEFSLIHFLETYATVELAMEQFDESFYKNKSIVTAGIDLFNELDKQVLPKKGIPPGDIDLFTEEELKIPKTYLFNSSNVLINQIVSLVGKDKENDIAIVVNPDSEYLGVIKARLKERGINLLTKNFLSEDLQVRDILTFIDSSFRVTDLKIGDLSFVESFLGINPDRKFYQYYLASYVANKHKSNILNRIYNVMANIRNFTYEGLLNHISKEFNIRIKKEFVDLIKKLELYQNKINENNFDELNYFISHIDLEISQNRDGVLFVNALNSSFVDRQFIIFAGLDASWTKFNNDKPYINKIDEDKKNLGRFQILLSQGEHIFNFALTLKSGEKVIPCYYFNILVNENIRNFEDECFNPVMINFVLPEPINLPVKENQNAPAIPAIDCISQSSLNTYVICPKKYSFGKLIPHEHQAPLVKGNLLHSFAEFYFNHPDFAKKNIPKILGYIMNEYSGFVRETNIETEKTLFLIGMHSIMKFLDEKNFRKVESEKAENANENFLFAKTGRKKIYLNTEQWLVKNNSGIIGKIDLAFDNTIIDYKSSKVKKNEPELLEEFKPDLLKKNEDAQLNFQTVAYIASLREDTPLCEFDFLYVYILADFKNIINGIESKVSISNIRYIPFTFKEYITSRKCFDKINSFSKDKFLEKIGYENYKKVIEENFEKINFYRFTDIVEILEDRFYTLAIDELKYKLSDFGRRKKSSFIKETIKPLLASILRIRTGFVDEGLIFKDDVDIFLKFVNEKIEEINLYQNATFPNQPVFDLRGICQKCEYLYMCVGNKLWSANVE